MIDIKEIGIEDYKRKVSQPNDICLLKIKGEWSEYQMTTDEFGWLYVILSIDNKVYEISLLEIGKVLRRIGEVSKCQITKYKMD